MIKLKIKKYYGFTLVELIIVITILAILATVAFVSFQWYTLKSRDITRLTSVKNFEKWLQFFEWINSNYPMPDNKTDLLTWWNNIDSNCWQSTYKENSFLEKWNINICKRTSQPEDPQVSVRYNHTSTTFQNDRIYNEYWAANTPVTNIHSVANTDTNLDFSSVVFIR